MPLSKAKAAPTVEPIELKGRDEEEQQDDAGGDEASERQYPGLKVVLPTVLSICLTVFLTALVRAPRAGWQRADNASPGPHHCRRRCPGDIEPVPLL